MPSPENIQQPWIDIQGLPAPAEEISLATIVAGITVILIIIALARFIWQRPRLKALRQLQRLHKHTSDQRQQLFLLKQALQRGLQVNHLHKIVLDSVQQNDWQKFCQQLTTLQYQPTPPSNHEVVLLSKLACDWLKRV